MRVRRWNSPPTTGHRPVAKAGHWRWNFAGTTTTGPAKATGDHVDVRP